MADQGLVVQTSLKCKRGEKTTFLDRQRGGSAKKKKNAPERGTYPHSRVNSGRGKCGVLKSRNEAFYIRDDAPRDETEFPSGGKEKKKSQISGGRGKNPGWRGMRNLSEAGRN